MLISVGNFDVDDLFLICDQIVECLALHTCKLLVEMVLSYCFYMVFYLFIIFSVTLWL